MIASSVAESGVAEPGFDTTDVLGRRFIAWLIDALILLALIVALKIAFAVVGVVTLGLGFALFALIPAVPFCYSWFFLASRAAATPGQAFMGLTVVEQTTGRAPTTAEALVFTLLYYVSFIFPPVFLVALVTKGHRALHDILTGMVMIRAEALTMRGVAWKVSGRA